jgi:hypothetical protein
MNKKGSSHLELIIAFGLFLVVTLFLFVYLRPLETNKLSDIMVVSLKDSFLDNVSTNLITVFVNNSCAPTEISELNSLYRKARDNYYYILFSDEFSDKLGNCTDPVEIGSVSPEQVLSNNSLTKLEEGYYSNYSLLKDNLLVPQVLEFEIYSEDGEYTLRRGEIEDVDIISKRYLFKVLYSNGTLTNKYFIFRVW